jgi:hypothetical protein
MGINHKPIRRLRDSDVAIVSCEPIGQHNRLGSQGPLDGWCNQKAVVPPAQADYGINRHRRRINTVAAKQVRECEGGRGASPFKAVLGKTHRTEF